MSMRVVPSVRPLGTGEPDDLAIARRRLVGLSVQRRRRRLLVICLFIAAVIVTCVLAAKAYSLPAPYARAGLAEVHGQAAGAIAVPAARNDNTDTVALRSKSTAAAWDEGHATAFSCPLDGRLVSAASVTMADVSLLDGLVTVTRLEADATVSVADGKADGDAGGSYVEGITVDGQDVAVGDLPLTIKGVGVLHGLESHVARQDGSVEVHMTALRLELTDPWRGIPEGTDVVVGFAAAAADPESAARLVPPPPPVKPAKPAKTKKSAKKPKPLGGDSGDSFGGSSGGSSGGSGIKDNGGASSAGDSPPADMPAPTTTSAKLVKFPGAVFPVDGKYWYSDDWGAPRPDGHGHTGNDIFALRGTPLVAVQDGTIEELRWRSLGGNSLHLVNDHGDYFYYAHLDHYAHGLHNGQRVTAGEVIGYVGNTGNARTTPPHCHFEVHPGSGGPVDPFPYLEEWRGAKPPIVLVPADQAGAATVDGQTTPSTTAKYRRLDEPSPGATPAAARPAQHAGLPSVSAPVALVGLLLAEFARRRRSRSDLIRPTDLPAGLRRV